MRIKSVSAENFKNLKLDDVPFGPTTLVLGPNGVGKSNLLWLLHTCFAKKAELPEVQFKFPIEGPYPDPDLLARGEDEGSVTLTVSCFSASFADMKKACFGAPEAEPNEPTEKNAVPVKKSRAKPKQSDGTPTTQDATIEFKLKRRPDSVLFIVDKIIIGGAPIYKAEGGADDATQLKAIETWVAADLLAATTYIPNGRTLKRVRVPFRQEGDFNAVEDLENTMLRLLSSPKEDAETLDRVRHVLKDFFGIDDIRSELVMDARAPEKEGGPPAPPVPLTALKVGIRLRERTGKWFDLDRVGTGIQQILVIIAMIETSRSRIALVEEFETSLSPKMRNRLLAQLQSLVGADKPLRQVITTSHNVFKPKQNDIHSIGYVRISNDTAGFRLWAEQDWGSFMGGNEDWGPA